jgi:large subunit ribosomal protein L37Ae
MNTTKRFGARYGKRVKDRLRAIEQESKVRRHKCPYCRKVKVKRLSVGIFECEKCHAKFTGRAYSITQPKTEVIEEEVAIVEESPEEEESIEEENSEETTDEDSTDEDSDEETTDEPIDEEVPVEEEDKNG